MATYIGQPADHYRFTSPSSAAAPGWCEERGCCVWKVRPSLSEEGRTDGQNGGAGAGCDIGFHYICATIGSGRSLCPASALPFFSKPCRHLRMGFTSAPPSCLISSCYMNTPAKKLQYEAPAGEEFKLSSVPMNICIQFSGDADFEDFEEGEAL